MKNNLQTSFSFPGIITLMYHRIDVPDTNPWDICVSPKNFEEQIKFLKENFHIISSGEVISRVRPGKIESNAICITFDDGYADNYIHAKPVLEKYNCPATFFIPAAFINSVKPFWWDELEMILLRSKHLPELLSLQINGIAYEYKIEETNLSQNQWQQYKHWKCYEHPPSTRCAAFISIWGKLRPLNYSNIEKQMTIIKNWSKTGDIYINQRLPMDAQQLHELSKNKLFTIGLHTNTHPDLQGKSKQFQIDEISNCRNTLRTKFNIESNCLAYPYGRYDAVTIEAAKQLQLNGCFTTEAKCIYSNSDLTTLGRYQVADCSVDEFQKIFR